jgi:ATP/maltotriose-dependent transcriptional regulator MalT
MLDRSVGESLDTQGEFAYASTLKRGFLISQTVLAKITRPRLPRVLERERLFRLLDGCRDHPVIWVTGPAGAGKTTLIASYLDSRKFPCLWY